MSAVASSSALPKEKKSKSKTKDKALHKEKRSKHKPPAEEDEHGRNEGTDASLAYQPPPDAVRADYDVQFGEFDYDAVKSDPDAELWLVRVPANVKPKHLENVHISFPSTSRTTRVGAVQRSQTTYDVWASSRVRDASGGGDVGAGVGGEELSTLSVLLPRQKKGGKLYVAPKPITRHLVVAVPPARPSTDAPAQIYQNPPRHAYPPEVLTHRFMPYGSGGKEKEKETIDVDAMDVDLAPSLASAKAEKRGKAKGKEEKTKKRKVEAPVDSSPKVKKASKRAKTVS